MRGRLAAAAKIEAGVKVMSPAVAACAACGHVFSEEDALGACPVCGGTERTLQRVDLRVERPDPETTVKVRHTEERRPDGTTEIVEEAVDELKS